MITKNNLLGLFKSLSTSVLTDFQRLWRGGVFHLTAANWLSRGAALGQRIVLARILGPQNIGHIGVANAALSLIRLPAGAGTFTVVTKLVAENIGQHEKQREVLGTALWINFVTSIVIAVPAWFFLAKTQLLGDLVAQNILTVLILLLPVMVFNEVFQSALIGERRLKDVAIVRFFISFFSVLAVIPMALVWSLNGWLYNTFLVIISSFVILIWMLRHMTSLRWNSTTAKRVASIGSFAFAGQLMGTLIYQVDTLSVSGILKDPATTGIYNTASLVAQQMIVIPGAVLQAAFPFVAQNSNNFKILKLRYDELIKKLSYLGFVMVAAAWFLSPWFFPLFGSDFSASVSVFRILAIGVIPSSLCVLDNTYLDALGRTDIHFWSGLFSAGCAICLNFLFIPLWGLVGAAWATTATMFISFILRQAAVRYFIFYKQAIR